jgi:hypothetical protein
MLIVLKDVPRRERGACAVEKGPAQLAPWPSPNQVMLQLALSHVTTHLHCFRSVRKPLHQALDSYFILENTIFLGCQNKNINLWRNLTTAENLWPDQYGFQPSTDRC